jgi:hypothetical protein
MISQPVENGDYCAGQDAENLGEVLGFVAFEERRFCPRGRWEIGSWHSGNFKL